MFKTIVAHHGLGPTHLIKVKLAPTFLQNTLFSAKARRLTQVHQQLGFVMKQRHQTNLAYHVDQLQNQQPDKLFTVV
jgi:hypothetical protein